MAKRTGATKNKPAKPPTKAVKPKTRLASQPLPGMENSRIQELDDAAAYYADIRDQRIALNVDEARLKDKTMRLMRQHGKKVYKHDGILIEITPGEDDLRVRVKPAKDDAAAANA